MAIILWSHMARAIKEGDVCGAINDHRDIVPDFDRQTLFENWVTLLAPVAIRNNNASLHLVKKNSWFCWLDKICKIQANQIVS